MARNVRSTFLSVLVAMVFLVALCHYFFRHDLSFTSSSDVSLFYPLPINSQPNTHKANTNSNANHAIHENLTRPAEPLVCLFTDSSIPISTVSVLFPAWEVLVIASREFKLPADSDEYLCVYPNNDTSPAIPAAAFPFSHRKTFKCLLPRRIRYRLPFPQPVLAKLSEKYPERVSSDRELLRWNRIVFYSLTTDNDVVLFAKGVNKRQGINRSPTELGCVFGDNVNDAVRTAVTASIQEVFRCPRPERMAVTRSGGEEAEDQIKVSLEILAEERVVPSVAYYTPTSMIPIQQPKSLICACTMVYNVGKFLKEWVMYHSKIGVEKFILYDNDSDDNLGRVIQELVEAGFDVKTIFWQWPKTQEAGFSHCAIYAKESCLWMMFIDVDEFVYSPDWYTNSLNASKSMLQSLLPASNHQKSIGQVMIKCYEFGPSNQMSHPISGVTQGYNCRRRMDSRHKSIVMLDAVNHTLFNAVHHFSLKEGYRGKKLNLNEAVINHYKYQAWPEFKTKFRRRVSAYVVDWKDEVNPKSKDRTPGLGFEPFEPQGWPQKFCEMNDDKLKELTRRWFAGFESSSGYQMAWQN